APRRQWARPCRRRGRLRARKAAGALRGGHAQAGGAGTAARARLDPRTGDRADDPDHLDQDRLAPDRGVTGAVHRVPAKVVVLAGPSGSGKSRVANRLGLPMLRLDDFYREADEPGLPRTDFAASGSASVD